MLSSSHMFTLKTKEHQHGSRGDKPRAMSYSKDRDRDLPDLEHNAAMEGYVISHTMHKHTIYG
jgi:hypothetical protein